MQKILWDNKVDARVLGGARINKVIADDMNQIKTAINTLVDSGADLPQFSTAARDLITPAPVLGYRIYNTTENRGEYYTSGGWLPFMGLKDIHAGSSPNFPASLRGDILRVTANGRLGGVNGLSVFAGDLVYCYTANAGGTYASVGANFKRIGLPPSLTTAQINALTQPQEVGLVYDTDLNVMKFYNGVLWLALVAMFFGDEYEVFASTPTAGQFFYATDTGAMYFGDGASIKQVDSLPFEGEITVGGDEYFFGVGNFLGFDAFGTLINNGTALQGWIDGFGFFQIKDFGLLGSASINIASDQPQVEILLNDGTNEFSAIFEPTTIKFEDVNAPAGEGLGLLFDLTTHNFISEWIGNFNFADDTEAEYGGVEINGLYHDNGAVRIRLT